MRRTIASCIRVEVFHITRIQDFPALSDVFFSSSRSIGVVVYVERFLMQGYLQQVKGFTQKAMEAVLHAQKHALLLRQSPIDTQHLLLGLMDTRETLALHILSQQAVTVEQVQAEVLQVAPQGTGRPDLEMLTQGKMTEAAERVLLFAREEAQRLGCSPKHISTPYLLLGLLREDSGLAAQSLNRLGIHLESIRAIVTHTIDDKASADEDREALEIARRAVAGEEFM